MTEPPRYDGPLRHDRAHQISLLCERAGLTTLAHQYVADEDMTLDDVKDSLLITLAERLRTVFRKCGACCRTERAETTNQDATETEPRQHELEILYEQLIAA